MSPPPDEDAALSDLFAKMKSRPDKDCLVWMVSWSSSSSTPPERVTLLEESAEAAKRILPRYECAAMQQRVRDGDSGRQLQGVTVRRAALGKLMAGLLFGQNKKVEVYHRKKSGYELSHGGTPAQHSELSELMSEDGDGGNGDIGGEDDCVMDDFSRPVAAITVESSPSVGFPRLGLFILDKGARTVRLCGFEDNSECDMMESVLENVSPLECRVPKNWDEGTKAGQVLSAKGVAVVRAEVRAKRDFEEAVKSLDKYVDFSKHDLGVLEKDGSQSLRTGTLVTDLLEAAQTDEGPKKKTFRFALEVVNAGGFVRLSASTLEGLHVFEGAKSLFSILNHTRTAGGDRLLRTWLRQPLKWPKDIRRRLDIVEVLREEAGLKKTLHERSLRRVPDLQKIYRKLQTKRLTLGDLYKAYCGIKEAGSILSLLEKHLDEMEESSAVKVDLVDPLGSCLPKLKKFEQLCEKTLDDDALCEGEYRVRASFDETLTELKEKIDSVKKKISQTGKKEAQRLGVEFDKVLKLESSAQHGYYFRVTLKDERLLRQKKGVAIFDSTKAGVKFRTPAMETLSAEFEELSRSYNLHQQYIVDEILQIAEGYGAHLLALYSVLSRLDCLVSFAVAADSAPLPYVKPEVLDEEDGEQVLELREARHPILEQMGVNFIPNDVNLDRKSNFKIITGPNLGGKSTYMRTAGLCVYMAQLGSFVPCSYARFSAFDALLVRMGAGDSQRRGVSTFMAEMLDSARILRDASSRSLVLVDELGRGTSTYDGFGLAWAIARRLATSTKDGQQPGAFAFFATHFHEMTKLSEEVPSVANLYCDALVKDGEFILLYAIQPGVCHNSFGIEVARMAGFPEKVLGWAGKYLSESESELRGAFQYREEVRRLVSDFEAAEGDEGRKRAIQEEARELAKKMRVANGEEQ